MNNIRMEIIQDYLHEIQQKKTYDFNTYDISRDEQYLLLNCDSGTITIPLHKVITPKTIACKVVEKNSEFGQMEAAIASLNTKDTEQFVRELFKEMNRKRLLQSANRNSPTIV